MDQFAYNSERWGCKIWKKKWQICRGMPPPPPPPVTQRSPVTKVWWISISPAGGRVCCSIGQQWYCGGFFIGQRRYLRWNLYWTAAVLRWYRIGQWRCTRPPVGDWQFHHNDHIRQTVGRHWPTAGRPVWRGRDPQEAERGDTSTAEPITVGSDTTLWKIVCKRSGTPSKSGYP